MTEKRRGDAGKQGRGGRSAGRGKGIAAAARKVVSDLLPAGSAAETPTAAPEHDEITPAMESPPVAQNETAPFAAEAGEAGPVREALEASTALPDPAPAGSDGLVVSYGEAEQQAPAPELAIPHAEALIAAAPPAQAETAQADTVQGAIQNAAQEAAQDAVQASADAAGAVADLADEAVTASAGAVQDTLQSTHEIAQDIAPAMVEQAAETMRQGADTVAPVAQAALEAGESAAASVGEAAEGAVEAARQAGAEMARVGTDMAGNLARQAADAAPRAADAARRVAEVGAGTARAALDVGGDALGRAMMDSAAAAARGLFELNGRMVEMVRANNEAALALWQATLTAGSGPDAMRVQAEALRRTYQITAEQWQDLAQAVARVMGETWQPLQTLRDQHGAGRFGGGLT